MLPIIAILKFTGELYLSKKCFSFEILIQYFVSCSSSSLNLYEIGLQKCETQLSEITARVTRDLVFFLDRFHYVHIKIIDAIVDYVLKQHEHLGPSTIINAYVLCFSSGYSTKALDRLAPVTLKLLEL